MNQIIKQKLPIDAKYLDSNIEDHVLAKLKRIMEGKCTFSNGYIISVNKVVELGDNTISSANSLVVFDVMYEAKVLKPEAGKILEGIVCMVFQHGIFVDVCGKMKVLIPAPSMVGYMYNQDNNSFSCDIDIIEMGSELHIEIVETKYEKKQFSCIGKIL